MPLVRSLLLDYWRLFEPAKPHLVLSLIGGAKNFRMEGRKKDTFKKGLISAARSTNALILTGGTNTGTMKLVGEAVRDGQFMVQVQ
jgi:transient receptor potential cation channel subfamily M protein 2